MGKAPGVSVMEIDGMGSFNGAPFSAGLKSVCYQPNAWSGTETPERFGTASRLKLNAIG
jgi:hypothetical protein